MKTLLTAAAFILSLNCFAQEPKLILPIGHTEKISNAVYSPDGKYIASASQDKTIKLWDTKEGALLVDINQHSCGRNTIIFSSDSRMFLTYSAQKDMCYGDSFAIVWDAKTTQELFRITGHRESILWATFSPDGKIIATASVDSSICLWNTANGKLLQRAKGFSAKVNTVMFSGDGLRLVSASDDGAVITWNVPQLSQERVIATGYTEGVSYAAFSPDGRKLIVAGANESLDSSSFTLWDSFTGRLLFVLGRNFDMSIITPSTAGFSSDGKYVLLSSLVSEVWEVAKGKRIFPVEELPPLGNPLRTVYFNRYANSLGYPGRLSSKGRLIAIIESGFDTVRVYNYETGKQYRSFSAEGVKFNSVAFSPDGSRLLCATNNESVNTWNLETGLAETEIKGHTVKAESVYCSPDGNKVLTIGYKQQAKLWDANTGALLFNFQNAKNNFAVVRFSPDGRMVATLRSTIHFNNLAEDRIATVWDMRTGKEITMLEGHTNAINDLCFSPDGEKIITASDDKTAIIWEAETGKQLLVLKGHEGDVAYAAFAPTTSLKNNTVAKIATVSTDGILNLWNAQNGQLLVTVKAHDADIESAIFNVEGNKIVTTSRDGTFKVWDTENGNQLFQQRLFAAGTYYAYPVSFTPDSKRLLAQSVTGIRCFDAETGELIYHIKMDSTRPGEMKLSRDGKQLLVKEFEERKIDFRCILRIYDVYTGRLLKTLKRKSSSLGLNAITFNADASRVYVMEDNNTCTVWNTAGGDLLYQFFAVDSVDYLVTDTKQHYDGSVNARKLIYFTCATEVIKLDQLKDQLWVPNLVSRIIKNEPVNEPGIASLNICNLTPLVEASAVTGQYRFYITPRRGGVGDIILSVNGIEVKHYQPRDLVKQGNNYLLSVSSSLIKPFLKSGENNNVQVRALVNGNTISSRGSELTAEVVTVQPAAPQLFAVFIGISDYKGTELDLQYAAKDADDLSNAFAIASRKLLNTVPGKEQVYIYRLHTGDNRTGFPDKNTIKLTLQEIGKKAGPNDILFIFFAGHGVMLGEKKQFYLLTADASKITAMEAVNQVGISTGELTEWIKPGIINAQKRILIFDACNSGQAIRDFVKIGGNNQTYIAARSDEESQQIKAIEKLNERSGLFILSASASNQSAYELGLYSQGLLTYSLLKTMKQSPDILEKGKYLDVSKWFNASRDLVNETVRQNGVRQEPQLISTTNFTVAVVDDEVRNQIHLPQEKPVFTASNLQNSDEAVAADDLEISKLVDEQLQFHAGKQEQASFVFLNNTSDAYIVSGRYDVKGNDVTVKVNIRKSKEVKYRFEVTGSREQLKELAEIIVQKVAEMIK